jgi:hypothetical protein
MATAIDYGRSMTPLLLMVAAAASACAQPTHFSPNEKWLKGDYVVTPVVEASQASTMKRLGGTTFRRVGLSFAKAVTRDTSIRSGQHYYLTKVAWFSGAPRGTVPGTLIKMGVDVDSHRVAYLTSFLLTKSQETSEFTAILISSVSLRGVVPICRAAE